MDVLQDNVKRLLDGDHRVFGLRHTSSYSTSMCTRFLTQNEGGRLGTTLRTV
jgi:hypothetical protein